MALTKVDIGAEANDGTGDPLRVAFGKVNDSLDYLDGKTFTPDAENVAVADTGGNFTGTDVEAVLAELAASQVSNVAAADVSVADAGGNFTATDVEAALTELAQAIDATTASDIAITDTAGNFTATDVEAALAELASSDSVGVTGPASSVDENIAVFDGTTGAKIKDGGKTIASLRTQAYVSVTGSLTLTDTHLGSTLVYDGTSDITLTVDNAVSDGFWCTVITTSQNEITVAKEGTDSLVPSDASVLAAASGKVRAASIYHHAGTIWVITSERLIESFSFACSDESTDLTTGTGVVSYRMPYDFVVTEVRASVNTAPVGATVTVDINADGTSILSTKLTIDASEKTSETAATAAVISDSTLGDDSEITIDIDQVGSSTAGKGLKVTLLGYRA